MNHVVTVHRHGSGPATVACPCGWPITQPAPHTGGRLAAARVHARACGGYVRWNRWGSRPVAVAPGGVA